MLMVCRAFPERPGVGAVERSSPFDPLDGVSGCLGAASEDSAMARLSRLPPVRTGVAASPFAPVLRKEDHEYSIHHWAENAAATWERQSPWSASCLRRSCGPLWGPLHTPFYWELRTETIMTWHFADHHALPNPPWERLINSIYFKEISQLLIFKDNHGAISHNFIFLLASTYSAVAGLAEVTASSSQALLAAAASHINLPLIHFVWAARLSLPLALHLCASLTSWLT